VSALGGEDCQSQDEVGRIRMLPFIAVMCAVLPTPSDGDRR
jgi:hypothetical protein